MAATWLGVRKVSFSIFCVNFEQIEGVGRIFQHKQHDRADLEQLDLFTSTQWKRIYILASATNGIGHKLDDLTE